MRTTARIFSTFENKSLARSEVTVECLEKAEKYWLKESMHRTAIELKKRNLNPLRPSKDDESII